VPIKDRTACPAQFSVGEHPYQKLRGFLLSPPLDLNDPRNRESVRVPLLAQRRRHYAANIESATNYFETFYFTIKKYRLGNRE
jgi:hypothetical protein